MTITKKKTFCSLAIEKKSDNLEYTTLKKKIKIALHIMVRFSQHVEKIVYES
jgi:hypothetical protein